MPSAFERFATIDAAKFVDPTTLGVPAVYTPEGGVAATINVSFAMPTVAVPLGDTNVLDSQPSALARAVDVPNPGPGDRLVIEGRVFSIIEALPDGAGHIWLRLTLYTITADSTVITADSTLVTVDNG